MELSKEEKVILGRYRERMHIAGKLEKGYGMRAEALRYAGRRQPGVDVDRGLESLVGKGVLRPNAAGTWYLLTEQGAFVVSGLPLGGG